MNREQQISDVFDKYYWHCLTTWFPNLIRNMTPAEGGANLFNNAPLHTNADTNPTFNRVKVYESRNSMKR